jgi:hypothetical protein
MLNAQIMARLIQRMAAAAYRVSGVRVETSISQTARENRAYGRSKNCGKLWIEIKQ